LPPYFLNQTLLFSFIILVSAFVMCIDALAILWV